MEKMEVEQQQQDRLQKPSLVLRQFQIMCLYSCFDIFTWVRYVPNASSFRFGHESNNRKNDKTTEQTRTFIERSQNKSIPMNSLYFSTGHFP
jgi:hypothetical protein